MNAVDVVARLLPLLTEDEMIEMVKRVETSINRRVRADIEAQTKHHKVSRQNLEAEIQRIKEHLSTVSHPSKRRQIEKQLKIVEDMREQEIRAINAIKCNHSDRIVSFFHMGMPQG